MYVLESLACVGGAERACTSSSEEREARSTSLDASMSSTMVPLPGRWAVDALDLVLRAA